MPDLLLWFENWREETRRVEEIKSNKLPDETQVLLRPTSVTFEVCNILMTCYFVQNFTFKVNINLVCIRFHIVRFNNIRQGELSDRMIEQTDTAQGER